MISFREIRLLLIAMVTAFVILSCGGANNNPVSNPSQSTTLFTDCHVIQHQMGKTEICGQPQNIVALGPNMLELLLALGMQPAGYAEHSAFHQGDYDNPSQQIPYLGDRITSQPINVGLDDNPSIEKLLTAQPDLILATETNKAQYEALSQLAPTLLFNWSETDTNLRAIARAVGRTAQAERLLAEVEKQIKTTRQTFAPIVASHPQVVMLSSAEAQQFNLVTHKNSVCGSLVNELGFQLVYPSEINDATLNSPTLPISLETLPQLDNADSVILLGFNFDPNQSVGDFGKGQLQHLEQGWTKNAIAQSLQASKAGRVYFIPAYVCFGLPGPIGTKLYLEELKEQLLSPS